MNRRALSPVVASIILLLGICLGSVVWIPLTERFFVPSQPQPWIVTVWGYASNIASKQPLEGVHVLAFGGNSWYLETPYISSVFDAYTDSEGYYYIEVPTLMATSDSHVPPRGQVKVVASLNSDTYLIGNSPIVLSSSDAQSFQPDPIDRWEIQCNLSLVILKNTGTCPNVTVPTLHAFVDENVTIPFPSGYGGNLDFLYGQGNISLGRPWYDSITFYSNILPVNSTFTITGYLLGSPDLTLTVDYYYKVAENEYAFLFTRSFTVVVHPFLKVTEES